MIQKLINLILAPRHPWRQLSFSELSEMYLAVFMRTMAISMVGIFVPLYLLDTGYGFTDVLLFYALFYFFGVFADFLVGFLIARFGPKHVMRLGFLFQTIFSLLLVSISHIAVAVLFLALIASLASTMYFLPYHIDFSKIKHVNHSGKEIGFLYVMEKVAAITGPLLGGIVATLVHPRATFWVAAMAMLVATIVLMLSPEPVQTHQKLRFTGLSVKKAWRDYVSYAALSIEFGASVWLWPVYLAAVVFTGSAYLEMGAVASTSVFIAAIAAVPLGRLLDRQRGRLMIRYATVVNTGIHLARLAVGTITGAFVVAALNEPNTLVYRMAYFKGLYDSADDYPGYRISYLTTHEVVGDIARATFWFTLVVLSVFTTPYVVCAVGFVGAAICSLAIRLERFRALR